MKDILHDEKNCGYIINNWYMSLLSRCETKEYLARLAPPGVLANGRFSCELAISCHLEIIQGFYFPKSHGFSLPLTSILS